MQINNQGDPSHHICQDDDSKNFKSQTITNVENDVDKSENCWGMTYIFYNHYERHVEDAKIIKTTTYDMIQQSVPEYIAEEKKLGCT